MDTVEEKFIKGNIETIVNRDSVLPLDVIDMIEIQKRFDRIILSLGSKENIMENLIEINLLISKFHLDIHQFELNVLINLYVDPSSDTFEQNERSEFSHLLSSIIAEILTEYPDELVDAAVQSGIVQIAAEIYPNDHISQVILPLVAKSGTAAKFFIENGILDAMLKIIQDVSNCDKYSILCIGAFGYYPGFSQHLLSFAPILFNYFLNIENFDIKYTSGKALRNLILCDDEICNSLFKNENFDILLESIGNSDSPEIDEIIICLISAIISRNSISLDYKLKAIDILTPKFEEFLEKYSDVSVLDLICCLVDAFADSTISGSLIIQKLIENNILQLCFSVYQLDLTQKLRIHFINLVLKSFVNADEGQISFFIENDIINLLLETINITREQIPRILLDALLKCCSIIENEQNYELFETICNDPNIEDALECLSQSDDYEIKYGAIEMQRLLNNEEV